MRETRHIRPGSRAAVLAVAFVMAGAGAACSGGASGTGGADTTAPTPVARPSSPATLTILSPRNGQVITGSTVHVRVLLKGAHIVPATTTHVTPTQGHLHVFLDNKIVSMNYKPDGVIADVPPGQHTLRVEFVASDHLPFDPRVFKGVVFEVKS